ncbi:MFS transporter, partial [Bradyrhizobium erythrophlei]|uniref:MFS transporter n=1 Tax=Bradyrhizobium erythrophlei TaxID=1437360 RepID=UPI0035E6161F
PPAQTHSNASISGFFSRLLGRKTVCPPLWGLISCAMMFVSTPSQFYVMRFLLGAAEAGLFPGVIFYLTYWFPASRRGRVTGYFMMGAAFAGIIGGPVATWIMVHLADLLSLKGWQWLFLIEGIPAVVLGITAYFYLSDDPKQAGWLSDREKGIVQAALAAEDDGRSTSHDHGLRDAFANPKLYVGILSYFTVVVSFNAIAFWTPTIFKDVGVKYLSDVGLYSSLVFFSGALGNYFIGFSSDRYLERRWHFAVCAAVIAACFALLPLAAHNVASVLGLLMIAAAASYGGFVVFWTMPPSFLSQASKAGGIALITALGGFGKFVSPTVIGWTKSVTGSIYLGFTILGLISIIGAAIIVLGIAPTIAGERRKSRSNAYGREDSRKPSEDGHYCFATALG